MILIKPSVVILECDRDCILHSIEESARLCKKSEDKTGSNPKFIQQLIKVGHVSILEHTFIKVRFVCDRGVSHELVRHRLCAFSQESTRYCDYMNGHVTFIIPPWVGIEPGEYNWKKIVENFFIGTESKWLSAMMSAEDTYKFLRSNLGGNWKPEQARSVLPNSLKTEIDVTANARQWRHILELRTAMTAHPQMRELMKPLLSDFQIRLPEVFGDISE